MLFAGRTYVSAFQINLFNYKASGLETREYGRRDPSRWTRGTLYPQIVGTNFSDKQRSLGRYSSLADSSHVVQL
jgi:hypothetical protein